MADFPLIHLWDKKYLIRHFAILNIKMRFKNTYLGFVWAAIEPLIYFTVLYLVFAGIWEAETEFAIYLISGIIIYHIFARGTAGGLVSLTGNKGILKSIYFRREFFPVVATLAIAILSFVDVAVFFGMMPIFQFVPSWTIVLLPVVLVLVLVLVLGMSYLLSVLNVFIRDTQNIWFILTHALLFVSPIFWQVEDAGSILLQIHSINPVGQLIEITHQLVVDHQIPPLGDWVTVSLYVFGIFFFGFFVFQKFESRIVEEL